MHRTQIIMITLLMIPILGSSPQAQRVSDATTALHALQPDYRTPYGSQSIETITDILKRVRSYLDKVTPAQLVDRQSQTPITDLEQAAENAIFAQGDFRLTSYEWGVTYAGMLNAGKATGDDRFTDYAARPSRRHLCGHRHGL